MMKVVIMGIRGSYSHEAARSMLGNSIELLECRDFESVFDTARESGELAVVPVRNSIAGPIEMPSHLLAASGFEVYDEIVLPIEHVLAAVRGTVFSELDTVVSHPEALKQCRKFLSANANLSTKHAPDTATAVRDVAVSGNPRVAAIGSGRAVEMYDAVLLRENIADTADNRTTFYLVGNDPNRSKKYA